MKIQHKVTVLLASIFAVFLLLFLGYLYISNIQGSLYRNSKRSSDEQIISKVLDFKGESFTESTKDNGMWDQMVEFTRTKDTNVERKLAIYHYYFWHDKFCSLLKRWNTPIQSKRLNT